MRRLFFLLVALSLLAYSTGNATIKLLLYTYEGFVVAADSRVTLSEKKKQRIASDSYQKIFRVGQFVGVACSGAAFLYDENANKRNIGSIVGGYKIRNNISDGSVVSPREVADSLRRIVEGMYNKQRINLKEGNLNLWVFGYDERKDRKMFEVYLKKDSLEINGVVKEQHVSSTAGSRVEGQTNVYTRLIKGYDPELLKDSCFENDSEKLEDLRFDIRYDLMSLQDAIDFAVFIVRATIEAQRFNQNAVMGVGGNIDIAIITSEGFRWIQKKKLHGEGELGDFESIK